MGVMNASLLRRLLSHLPEVIHLSFDHIPSKRSTAHPPSTRLGRLPEGRTALPAADLIKHQRLRIGSGVVREKPQRAVAVAAVAGLEGRNAATTVASVLAASI